MQTAACTSCAVDAGALVTAPMTESLGHNIGEEEDKESKEDGANLLADSVSSYLVLRRPQSVKVLCDFVIQLMRVLE